MILQAINWNPSPIMFELGPLAIRYYGLTWALAFIIGMFIEKKIYKNDNVDEEIVDKLFIYTIIATVFGARLGEVLFYDNWSYYKHNLFEIFIPVKFNPFEVVGFMGLASHGAAMGVIISMYFFQKFVLKEKSMLWILDRVVLTVPIGGALIRIGNLMNSEIIGKYTGTDYGFIFERLGDTLPRHPSQIYEALTYVVIFALLWYVYWKTDKKHKEGYLFGVFMVLLWSGRFFLEYFKEAQIEERGLWTLNTGQLLSIPLVLVGLYFVFRKVKTAYN